jgi:O-antigen ligase
MSGTPAAAPSIAEAALADERPRVDVLRQAAWWTAAATAVITPVFVSKASLDMFAAPKELVLRAGGILVLLALILRAIYAHRSLLADLRAHRVTAILAGAAVVWTGVATIFSTNQLLSAWTLLRVALCAAIAVAAVIGVARRRFETLYLLFLPAILNVIVLIGQERQLFDPIYPPHMRWLRSGLIGNPNWIGTYLLVPALAALALVFCTPKRRALHVALAVFLALGLVAAQSVTAIGAYAVGAVAIGAMYSWKRAAAICILAALALGAVVMLYPPARRRAQTFRDAAAARDVNWLTSSRMTAYAAALEMFLDRPLVGMGPGCYALHYFTYKIEVEAEHPQLQQSFDRQSNFGEAHNDHLEIMAVTGLPGYAILAVVLIVVGRRSWLVRKTRRDSARHAFVYACSFPLAAATAVLMLAQFPLELAASTATLLVAAAFCVGWSDDVEAA